MRTERRRGALTIGKLAGAAGLTVEGVRYYERQGLLDPPARSAAGYRLYPPDALTRLTFIRQAKAIGLSLKEVRQILALSRAGVRPCEEVRAFMRRKLAELDRTLRDVKALRQRLNETLARWEGLPEAPPGGHVCGLIELAAGRAEGPPAGRPGGEDTGDTPGGGRRSTDPWRSSKGKSTSARTRPAGARSR